MKPIRTIILGAAGRDFHNFNTYFRDNDKYKVVAFTAAQIPNIENKRYPNSLTGKNYSQGIPIYSESLLPELVKSMKVDLCSLSYSDISNQKVMELAAGVQALGADFMLLGPESTQLKSKKPVIAITAVRTGAGKSQISDYVADFLTKINVKYTIVRHPMPYGNLEKQRVQIYNSPRDLDNYDTTIEEREEYEKHLNRGRIVLAGIEYSEILKEAESRSEVIIWDGGNNDFSFIKPDLQITIVDPLRENHELLYYPGLTNLMTADIVVINKENTATKAQINNAMENIKIMNPKAKIVHTNSLVKLTQKIKPRTKAIIIEDGPTTTHGGMSYGAGYLAAKQAKLKIVDPKPHAVGSLRKIYSSYPHLKEIIPAMGYYPKQLLDLKKTIEKSGAKVAIIGTPIDLSKLLQLKIPSVRADYFIKEKGNTLKREVLKFVRNI